MVNRVVLVGNLGGNPESLPMFRSAQMSVAAATTDMHSTSRSRRRDA